MNLLQIYNEFSRKQKIILFTGLFFIFYTIFGFFILPKIIQTVSEGKLTQFLGRKVTIQKVKFNPYSLFLTVEGMNIKQKKSEQHFVSFNNLFVNIQSSSLFKLGPVIRDITIDGLSVNAIRNKDLTYNFIDLIPSKTKDKTLAEKSIDEAEKKPPKKFRFSVSNIVLNNGKIIIDDRPKNKTHALTEIQIAIPFVSNLKTHMDIFVTPHFSVNFNGSPIELKAQSKPFIASQTTQLDLDLKDIDLKTYYDYIPIETNMDLKSGILDLFCSIEFSQNDDKESLPQLFLSGQMKLSMIGITDLKTNPIFNMSELSISLERSEVLKGDININEIIGSSPNISLSMEGSNDDLSKLNVFSLIPKNSKDDPKVNVSTNVTAPSDKSLPVQLSCNKVDINNILVTLKDASSKKEILFLQNFKVKNLAVGTEQKLVNIGNMSVQNGNLNIYRLVDNRINLEVMLPQQEKNIDHEPENKNSPVWNAKINNIEFDTLSIAANDLVSKDKGQVLIENIAFDSKGFSTFKGKRSDTTLGFQVNKSGRVDIAGQVGINPLNADVDLAVDKINLASFQPFISEYLNLVISKGEFSTIGRVGMEKVIDKPLKAKYEGDVSIAGFQAVGSHNTNKLIGFKNVGIKNIDFNAEPISVNVKTLKIQEPVINAAIYSDGTLNLSKIVKVTDNKSDIKSKVKDNNKPDKSPVPVKISQVIMEKGQVTFKDSSVSPKFKTKIKKINTKITGLSSEETIQSDVAIDFLVNNHTPVEINGKINPLKSDFFCDMIVSCSNMDLGYLSSYSGKYAGYKIQKGKLSIDLKYLIDKGKLDSKNDLFLDQFDFGAKVESEDAIKAPMNLAVALLKDTKGRIALNIPVTGELNDPEFSVAGVIIKVIVNLLAKAATSPFSLLGAMFEGGEDLDIISFEPGSFDITSQSAEKVETLVKALSERPGLNLEIEGYVNIEKDRIALKTTKLEQRLQAEKLKELIKQGKQAVPIDKITFSDEEYDIYVKTIYDQTEEGKITSAKENKPIKEKDTDITDDEEAVDSDEVLPITQEQMIQAIEKEIVVSDDELTHLASERALTIKGAILANGSIDTKRVFITEAKNLEPEKEGKAIDFGSVIMTLQ